MVTVSYDDIEMAFGFVNFGGMGEQEAFICLDSGEIYYRSEFGDDESEELPDDIDESDRYLAIPHKNELDLGRELALDFVEQELPDLFNKAQDIFHRAGAYVRFKDMLEYNGMLEKWYKFEAEATEKALREWCAENGIEVAEKAGPQA